MTTEDMLESVRKSLYSSALIAHTDLQGGPGWSTDAQNIIGFSQASRLAVGRNVEPPMTPPELFKHVAQTAKMPPPPPRAHSTTREEAKEKDVRRKRYANVVADGEKRTVTNHGTPTLPCKPIA